MDIELSTYKDGIAECVKLPLDGSAVVVGEWCGRRSHWLRSSAATKRVEKSIPDDEAFAA